MGKFIFRVMQKKAPKLITPLKNPVFRPIWQANVVSNMGSFIQLVAASWLMTRLTDSSTMVALVQGSSALPIMTLSLLAGAVADRFGRRQIMLCSQVFMLLVSVLLALFAWTDTITPWLLLSCTFLIGCGAAFNNPAWQASVGELLPPRELTAGIALNSISMNAARSVGPAVGGFLVAVAGAATAFLVNALSYIGIVAVLVRLGAGKSTQPQQRGPLMDSIGEGIKGVIAIMELRAALIRGFLFTFCGIAITSLMPIVTRDIIEGGAFSYGVLLGAFGSGGIVCALIMPKIRYYFSTEGIIKTSAVIMGVAAIIISSTSLLPLSILAHIACGAVWLLGVASVNVTVQTLAPDHMHARAVALYYLSIFGGMSLGSLMWGTVADTAGIVAAVAGSGMAQICAIALALVLPMPKVREAGLDGSAHS